MVCTHGDLYVLRLSREGEGGQDVLFQGRPTEGGRSGRPQKSSLLVVRVLVQVRLYGKRERGGRGVIRTETGKPRIVVEELQYHQGGVAVKYQDPPHPPPPPPPA